MIQRGQQMKSILAMLLFFSPLLAYSHNFHSETFCSDDTKEACAHIGYDSEFDTKSSFEFVFHVTTPGADKIEQVQIYFAQPELDIITDSVIAEKVGPGKYLMKNVQFSAPGQWEIRSEFDYKLFHQIFIPITVK